MEPIKVRSVKAGEAALLQAISRQTFSETFAADNKEDDMRLYLDEAFSPERLEAELKEEHSEFYFAETEGRIAGYIKLNSGSAQTVPQQERALEIERIYVLRAFQGRKIGQLLLDKAIALARQKHATYVWLGVWEKNHKAVGFYRKNGFAAFDQHMFKLGTDEQTDILMKKTLQPAAGFDIQPILENDRVILYPLTEADFGTLYAVASDPAVWEQHPNKNRWKEEVFRSFFEGAMQSKGAFKIVDKATGVAIGSTRFYDYNEAERSIFIGYTFYATTCWGQGINQSVKAMMLAYAFRFVDKVLFHIGAHNTRSQIAIGRTGARKVAEQEVTYFGEAPKLNFVYEIGKAGWEQRRNELS